MAIRSITILGTGALASVFGALLTRASGENTRITLFGTWKEQIRTVREQGLTLILPDGSESHVRLNATASLSEVPRSELALILVKSHQTARVAEQAATILHPDGVVVTLQNGLGNVERLAGAVGRQRVVAGITYIGAHVLHVGKVRHAVAAKTLLGRSPDLEPRLQQISALFNAAGIDTEVTPDIEQFIWRKLLVNAAINPLTALFEAKNRELLTAPLIRRAFEEGVKEVAEVARAQGITIPEDDPVQYALDVCKQTGANRSSMLQDILRGAPTEIDAIAGEVVRHGRKVGIPTPVNQFFLTHVHAKENGTPFDPKQLSRFLGSIIHEPQSSGR